MSEKKIRNPVTNRLIRIGGKTHTDLLLAGLVGPDAPVVATAEPFIAPPVRLPRRFKKYPVDRSDAPWGKKKPHTIPERRFVRERCGEGCFLDPDRLKFPICNKTMPCTYNARAITRAVPSRAGEWKYRTVLAKARELADRLGLSRSRSS
ncbi:hypothetical protein EBZ80_19735 [bacterium]|nr:hypothetical protein [bacterium]